MPSSPDTYEGLAQSLIQQKEEFAAGNYLAARQLAKLSNDAAVGICTVRNRRKTSCDVSIIVLSYQSNAHTLEMLDNLSTFSFDFSHEVIVVLNDDSNLRQLGVNDAFTLINSPVNLGASGGRNLGAHFANGRYLLYLDDDGSTTQASVAALYETATLYDATAVRGRVKPRNAEAVTPRHYDLGEAIRSSGMDIEGITIWNAERFNEVKGFDPLLFGHEGFELCARLYKSYGPQSFLYEPRAILLHDFETEAKPSEAKIKRYADNLKYLAWNNTPHTELIRTFNNFAYEPAEYSVLLSCLRNINAISGTDKSQDAVVSILTTAKNAGSFLEEYSKSLWKQTYRNFEVIFVDDNSEDETRDQMHHLWKDDDRLVIIGNHGVGRGAALNTAMAHAKGKYCVIADADDLMVPQRIEWSVRMLEEGRDAVSGYIFNELAAVRGTRPFVDRPTSIRLRCFAGMPASFPAFAFARERFVLPFSESLEAGIDCDWLFRNFSNDLTLNGDLIPYLCSYYRLHPDQITTGRRDLQREVGQRCVAQLHARFIPFDAGSDAVTLSKVMGWTPVEDLDEFFDLYAYASRFHGSAEMDEVRSYLFRAIDGLRTIRIRSGYMNVSRRLEATQTKMKARPDYLVSAETIARWVQIEDRWLADFRKYQAPRKWYELPRKLPEIPQHFDEAGYLEKYADVRQAVTKGRFLSGFQHFAAHGRREGRVRPIK